MISIKSIFHDDGAVSETLGYILLFGIALTAIAIILLVGNSIIDNEKSKDNFQNMIQTFDIIQSDMKQVALDGTPVKTTTLHMDGGAFSVNTDTNHMKVDIDGSTYYNADTGQFIFTKQDDTTNNVSIENGGVWMSSDGYSSLVSQPRIYITPGTDTLVLNVYRLKNPSSTNLANAGTGTMTIKMSYDSNSNARPAEDVHNNVMIWIDTKYPDAWKQYLNNAVVGTDVAVPQYIDYANGVEAKFTGVKKVIVSEHYIDVSLSGLYT